ncbi:MAG: hypothetical protein ACFCGT_09240 [Sandaracinaceae bacterium]
MTSLLCRASRLTPVALLASVACIGGPQVDSIAMEVRDPLALIDDVDGPLRLLLLPADRYACHDATGALTPEVPDVPLGEVPEAAVDVEIPVGESMAEASVDVRAGRYAVLVRGRGTDPVTDRRDVIIATGCDEVMVSGGQTTSVMIGLVPVVGEGVCGDGIVSPDEQCDDGGTEDGDGCTATCRSEPIAVNTTLEGLQENPRVGGAVGERFVVSFDSERLDVRLRLLEPDGAQIDRPSLLSLDVTARQLFGLGAGIVLLSDVAVDPSTGRSAVALTDFSMGVGQENVRVGFLTAERTAEELDPPVVDARAGARARPRVAVAPNGRVLVVYEDEGTGGGLGGRMYEPGSTSPSGTALGFGRSGSSGPAVAAGGGVFWVAYVAAGDIWVQRFDEQGRILDASPLGPAGDGLGEQDQPAIAAQEDGRALVAWRDDGPDGDGDGTAVRARVLEADGSLGAVLTVNGVTAGDQAEPSVAAGDGVFGVVFGSAGSIRGRVLSAEGVPVLNREAFPTTDDFEVAPRGSTPDAAPAGTTDVPGWVVTWAQGEDIAARVYPF